MQLTLKQQNVSFMHANEDVPLPVLILWWLEVWLGLCKEKTDPHVGTSLFLTWVLVISNLTWQLGGVNLADFFRVPGN